MPAHDSQSPDAPDEALLESISGKPPVDSYTGSDVPPEPSPRSPQTGWLTRLRPAAPRPPGPSLPYESKGLIDFIFYSINDWLDRLLDYLTAPWEEGGPSPYTAEPVPPAGPAAPATLSPDHALVTRLTALADLALPPALLQDPDLQRYFEQMRLYDYQTTRGGLNGLSYREVTNFLMRGKWGEQFRIRFPQLRLREPWPPDQAYERFVGMLPVYKAQANNFPNDRALQKAIEEDVVGFLRTGQGSVVFHPFFY